MQLRNKVVVITGASEGIGRACARAFASRGARVVATARSMGKLAAAVAESGAVAVAGDITEGECRKRVVETAVERFGRLDVVVNNAGVGLAAPAWRADLKQVRAMFELNVLAPLALIQEAAPHLRRSGGAVVNMSSIAGRFPLPWFTAYSASKYAVCGMSDGLRVELKPLGIRVMTVCPGYVKTSFGQHVLGGRTPEGLGRVRRFAITAEECAEATVRGLERGARTVVTPRVGWVAVWAYAVAPRMVDRILGRIYRQLEFPE